MGFYPGLFRGIHHAVLGVDAHCATQAKDWDYFRGDLSIGVELNEEEWRE